MTQLPLEARIVAVADAYEAMTSDRAYRAAIGHERARGELSAAPGPSSTRRSCGRSWRCWSSESARAQALLAET